MSGSERDAAGRDLSFAVSAIDLAVIASIIAGGLVFLSGARAWAPQVYIGNDQFGDADFWWQGALQLAQGILWDNINITFRMGYALFAGPFVALFGPEYAIFHETLILVFLAVAAGGYVIAAQRVGRITALAMIASLVFSPLQAERLAVSTSDGLGLIFNLVALLALWQALGSRLRIGALAVAGIFLALAGLTRPLMTLFIAPAALLVITLLRVNLLSRAIAAVALIAAFALPTIVWTTAFYFKTGRVGVAGHDASIFYAASDPNTQVWSPNMYRRIEEAAKARLGASNITEAQVNDEFRIQTLANYRKEFAYHLRRLPDHVLALAQFTFHRFNPGDHAERTIRIIVRLSLALALVVSCLIVGRYLSAVAVAALCVLSLLIATEKYVIAAAALCFLLPLPNLLPVHHMIAAYWWTGAAALYFTGGTWGPPVIATFDINALGYRLGSQFLFANEWLVILSLLAFAGVPRPVERWLALRSPAAIGGFDAKGVLRLASIAASICFFVAFIAGAAIAAARGWRLAHAEPVPMPPVKPLVAALCRSEGRRPSDDLPAANSVTVFASMWGESNPDSRLEGVHLFTGALGGLVWRMDDQSRTRALFYQQDRRLPFTINPSRTDVEFAGALTERDWRNRQGAWLVRSFREVGPHTGSLYQGSLPKVQTYVPLSEDGMRFDLAKAVRFPLARYASALAYAGRLKADEGRIEWLMYPTSDYQRRWFVLLPAEQVGPSREVALNLDLRDALGRRRLGFAFRVEPVPGDPNGAGPVSLLIDAIDADGRSRTLLRKNATAHGGPVEVATEDVRLDIPDDAVRLRIVFSGLSPKEMVRVVELQAIADDVAPGLTEALCAAR